MSARLKADPLAAIEATLQGFSRRGLARRMALPEGRDFSSNDYLGLAASPELAAAVAEGIARGVPVGAGGSRLLRGHHPEHALLEEEAARFFRAERCLLFGGGFAANQSLLAALPGPADLVLHDELVHASMHEGLRRSRAAARAFRHNDAGMAREALRLWRREGGRGAAWIALESRYSMEGDDAPLAAFAALADEAGAMLVVDEAHATGVAGPDGRGLAAAWEGRPNWIVLHTGGKALGAGGALVAADRRVIDLLAQRATPFVYATAPSPLLAAALRASLRLLAGQPWRRERLAALCRHAAERLGKLPGAAPRGGQILPILTGDSRRALALAAAARAAGFDCRAIRPPTVPPGGARLRISVTLHVGEREIDGLAAALAEALAGTLAGDQALAGSSNSPARATISAGA